MLLPTNASVITPVEQACFARNEQKKTRWLAAQRAKSDWNSSAQRRRAPPDESWLCYWNADLRVELGRVLSPLADYVLKLPITPRRRQQKKGLG